MNEIQALVPTWASGHSGLGLMIRSLGRSRQRLAASAFMETDCSALERIDLAPGIPNRARSSTG
jgi:hypothetical protein